MDRNFPSPRKDLEFMPIQDRGQQMILVRDQLGLVREGTVIAPGLYRFLYLLDTLKEYSELQLHLSRQAGGIFISVQEIRKMLDNLDKAFLLDSETYRIEKSRLKTAFAALQTRPPGHAGRSYPAGAEELGRTLDDILAAKKVPPPRGRIKGLVAPHIDLTVGARGYGAAYGSLKGSFYQRLVVLGVGHHMDQGLFSLTGKNFETVFGLLQNDASGVSELRENAGNILTDSDYDHRLEHSIEFQTLFLKHLFGGQNCLLIPILCGSMKHFLPEYSRQAFLDAAGPFLESLQRIAARDGTLIVAGVDFSHIGPKFGHEHPAKQMQSRAEDHDSALLDALCQQDPDRFWKVSREIDDFFHVCGFSALACLLEVLPDCRSEMLHYEMWHEEPTRSAVSFAALNFQDNCPGDLKETRDNVTIQV